MRKSQPNALRCGGPPEPAAHLASFTAKAAPLASGALFQSSLYRVNFSIAAPEGARAEENAAGLQQEPSRCCDAGDSGAVILHPLPRGPPLPRDTHQGCHPYVHFSGMGRQNWEQRPSQFAFLLKGWEGACAGEGGGGPRTREGAPLEISRASLATSYS